MVEMSLVQYPARGSRITSNQVKPSPAVQGCLHAKGNRMSSRLYPEDQKRVDAYLNQPENRVERKPFNVWLVLGVILGSVICMGLLARMLASLVLV